MCWWAAVASQVVAHNMESMSVPTMQTWQQPRTTALQTGYIAQWLERLTADQQVPGSNPGVPSHM